MDSATLFAAELNPNIATIDLHHTGTVADALEQLERELFLFYQNGEPYVRVVYGIGTGKLASAVQEALTKNPMIGSWEKEENGGSCIAVF